MRPARLLLASILSLTGVLAACTTTTTTTTQNKPNAENPNGEDPAKVDPEDPANQPPHSLGTIILGESHASGGGGTASPIVSATFVPDAIKARACTKKLDASCEIAERPKCTKTTENTSGCADNEVCTFDESCTSVCKKVAVCSLECEEDEVCTLDKAGKATCTKPETFDAGPIAFSGTTTPITLYPPYRYETTGTKGAPFLAGADIKVQASGATAAGFEKFEEQFKSTTFIQTTPALNKLSREKIFGTGSVPIAWAPGADTILVTVSGAGGAVTCKATDSAGKFDLPRTAIAAAMGDGKTGEGTQSLSLSVARQRKETKKDKKAKGELTAITVQPEGWLDLITVSTETTSFQGCPTGQSYCGTECVNLKTDAENCGACGKVCGSGMTCGNGTCANPADACKSCELGSKTSTCKTTWTACSSNTACNKLWTCLEACQTQSCAQTCVQQNPDGQSLAQSHAQCVQNACADVCGQ
jgi:hypothetical protein